MFYSSGLGVYQNHKDGLICVALNETTAREIALGLNQNATFKIKDYANGKYSQVYVNRVYVGMIQGDGVLLRPL